MHALKVKSVSDEYINLAKQDSSKLGQVSKEPNLASPVYKDAELVRRAQEDDMWAIEQLILRYQKKVYAIAYQMLSGDAEEAKDRTQDVFLQAFRKIKRFKGKSAFYTWLYRIVVNTCIDARRRKQRWKKIFRPWRFEKDNEEEFASSLEEYPDTDKNSDPLSTVSNKELQQDVKDAMKTLSKKQRTIFELKVFREMSILEIAELTGLAQGTVKTHLFRATRAIQKKLSKWAEV